MASLRAIYREPIQDVVECLNSSATALGFELLQPLAPETYDLDCFRLVGEELFTSIHQPHNYPGSETMRWFDIKGPRRLDDAIVDVFHNLLSAPLRPTEVLLTDHDIEFADGDFSYILPGEDPYAFLDTMESNYYLWGIHYLRALQSGTAGSNAEWSLRAQERGFKWSERDDYGILDLRWNEKGTPRPQRDPITGLPTEDEFFDYFRSHAQGTFIVVSLTAVKESSFERWNEILPEVARLLEDQLTPTGLLTRLYTPRRFALLQPALTATALATLLHDTFQEASGLVLSINWPDHTPADDIVFKVFELEDSGDGQL